MQHTMYICTYLSAAVDKQMHESVLLLVWLCRRGVGRYRALSGAAVQEAGYGRGGNPFVRCVSPRRRQGKPTSHPDTATKPG